MRPRAITGLGIVSPLGIGRAAFCEAMQRAAPDGATAGVTVFDASKYEGARVAEVRSFEPGKILGERGLRTLDRLSKLLIVAARLALQDAGLKSDATWSARPDAAAPWPNRVGLVVSNAYGSLEAINELDRVALLEDPRYINPARFPLTVSNSAAGYASIWEDMRALNVSVSNGNCGGLDAVACADMLLEGSRADVLLVGGAEALSEPLFVAFKRLGVDFGALDAFGRGGRLGEGAALLVLEMPASFQSRGATALAEIVGYGTAFEPPPHSGALLHPGQGALVDAIEAALADGGLDGKRIDLVVSGMSGIRVFDEAERTAIAKTLGRGVCLAAPKLRAGESLGAGAALGMAASLAYLCGSASADLLDGNLRTRPSHVLVTALGYYGNASALVMRASSG